MISCIEPLSFTTLDGAERKFRLTARELVLIAQKNGASLAGQSVFEGISRMLYECLVDKADLSVEDFQEILPPDDELLLGFHSALREHYRGPSAVREANEKYRPRTAATAMSSSNGSTSRPSGESTSEISENSGSSVSEKSEP